MEFTGERVIPGRTDPDLLNEHLARYRFAESLVGERVVVDAGCGAGYGSAALARRAAKVYGLDNAFRAVSHARGYYERPRFVQASCTAMPFPDGSADVVTAFEVIEHLEDWRGLIAEARRVLRPDGQFLVSTPNRPYYEKTRSEPNPFHVHEFDYEEFRAALGEFFPHITIFFENHTNAISFRSAQGEGVRTLLEGDDPAPAETHFFLAVCSQQAQYGAPTFVYIPEGGNVLGEREKHIAKLEEELAAKTQWLERATHDLDDLAARNREDQRRSVEAIERLEREMERKTAWAEEANQEVEKVRSDFKELQSEYAQRSEWAKKLQADYETALANYRKLEQQYEPEKAESLAKILKANQIIEELNQLVIERTEWAKALEDRLAGVRSSPAYRLAKTLGLAPKLS